MRGAHLIRKAYQAPSKAWDHDHCTGCWAKFMEPPTTGEGIVHEGYATTAEYVRGADYEWVCTKCFEEFSAIMGWIDASNSN